MRTTVIIAALGLVAALFMIFPPQSDFLSYSYQRWAANHPGVPPEELRRRYLRRSRGLGIVLLCLELMLLLARALRSL